MTATKDGSDSYDRSANTTLNASNLELSSSSNTLAWAVYTLNVGPFTPLSFEVDAQVSNGECYYALADYNTDSWHIMGPYAGSFSHSPTVDENVVDELSAWSQVAVLAWGGTDVTVQDVSFSFEQPQFTEAELENVGDYGDVSAAQDLNLPEQPPLLALIDGNDGRLELWHAASGYPTTIDDWENHVVDTQGAVQFKHAGLSFSYGRPQIVYTTSEDVRFAATQSLLPAGSSDWAITTIAPTTGNVPAVCESPDGLPLVAWGDDFGVGSGDNHVWFASAAQAVPASDDDWSRHWIEYLGQPFAGYCSITLVGGLPYVLYSYPTADSNYHVAVADIALPTNTFDWERVPLVLDDGVGGVADLQPQRQLPLVDGEFTTFCAYQDSNQDYSVAFVQDPDPPLASSSDVFTMGEKAQANVQATRYCDISKSADASSLYYFAVVTGADSGNYELQIGYSLIWYPLYLNSMGQAFYIAHYPLPSAAAGHQLQIMAQDGKPLLFYLSQEGSDWHLKELYQSN